MNSVQKEENGKNVIYFSGVIESEEEIISAFQSAKGTVEVNCDGIQRINSLGVRSWLSAFRKIKQLGVQVRFSHCPISIIQQALIFPGFIEKDQLDSFYIQFYCLNEACKKVTYKLIGTQELLSELEKGSPPVLTCPHCGKTAEFDDEPTPYIEYLEV
ncbi:MAG: hypothetical protein AABZ55_05590 [Bdellovibrionota bacterium]